MTILWHKIRFWFWWQFRATEQEKSDIDRFWYGTGIMKNGRRIDPSKFYIDPDGTPRND